MNSAAEAVDSATLNTRPFRRGVPLFVLGSYLLISWFFFGFAFGSRGLSGGDDFYMLTTSALGQFPACTAITNFINPWRPLYSVSICPLFQVVGWNVNALGSITFVICALVAFVWFGVVRNAFRLPTWFAYALGLLYLSYPDDWARLSLIEGIRMCGPLLTLVGVWYVLSYWDRPQERWRFVLGCVSAVIGLLVYESLIAVWAIALPLILLVKARRISIHWLIVSLMIEAIPVIYVLWRYLILPTTYNTEKTVVLGTLPLDTSPLHILGQARDSYTVSLALWQRAFGWIAEFQPLATPDDTRQIIIVTITAAIVTALALILIRRFVVGDPLPGRRQGAQMLGATLLLLPIFALPYFIVRRTFAVDTQHSFGTPFAMSVAIIGVILLLGRQPRLLTAAVSLITLAMVVFFTVLGGYMNLEYRNQARAICDFYLRFTDVVQRIPPNVYVLYGTQGDVRLPEILTDNFMTSMVQTLLYYEGPHTPDRYEIGRFGYMGYLMFTSPRITVTSQIVRTTWPYQIRLLHQLTPLPEGIPRSRAIVFAYVPFERINLISYPKNLAGLVINPQGGSTERAHALAQQICAW